MFLVFILRIVFFKLFPFIPILLLLARNNTVAAQGSQTLNKVLTLTGPKQGARDLPQDHGASGVWQRLLKLRTIASVLFTQAHPDDEHADVVTWASRGKGYRTALLSLNRGESGANVLGGEAFDHLGLLRTEEFLLAGAYYGLDDLYFTRLADYGYSKNVTETYNKWGKENILREIVRVIRLNRPLVIVSRFHGSARDGHGNHQAAGEITQQAFVMAGDPTAFPELISEGLQPWKAKKLYRGGIRAADNEPWHVALNTGVFNPWLGQSYKNFSLLGYSMHRSQVGGVRNTVNGPFTIHYERMHPSGMANKEADFFDGIDTSLTGIFKVTGEQAPESIHPLLEQANGAVQAAVQAFRIDDPAAVIPHLAKGLFSTRAAIRLLSNQPEALFLLRIKEQQFMDAIHTAAGMQLIATAMPRGTAESRSFFEPQPVMGHAVAGTPFTVKVVVVNNSSYRISEQQVQLVAAGNWQIIPLDTTAGPLPGHSKAEHGYSVSVPEGAAYSQPFFNRTSIQEGSYQLANRMYENLPHGPFALQAMIRYRIQDVWIEAIQPVQVRQSNLPFGYDLYPLKVAPAIAVNLKQRMAVVPSGTKNSAVVTEVELINNSDGPLQGTLVLKLPQGWRAEPEQSTFSFTKTGEKKGYRFKVTASAVEKKEYQIKALATAAGKTYSSGYDLIRYRDIDQNLLFYPATITVKGINVQVRPNLKIGYLMGVGDEVPAALQQLGTQVTLLHTADLAAGNLAQFDAIMIGIRAYAVRPDLNMYNQQLLDYSKKGGHLIVLYQSPEFVPDRMAPYGAKLPNNAEEIAEEDAPVTIMDPSHPVLHVPNRITATDFDNWVEQRGSKFLSEWDPSYKPIISSHDQGQAPQQGGWLMAKFGTGHYTYFAYSLHRQLPYGVEGAYRILANLVSYGKSKR